MKEALNEGLKKYKKSNMEGIVFKSKNYGNFKVIKYHNAHNVDVEFIYTGYKSTVQVSQVHHGNLMDRTIPMYYGKGFIGGTKYKSLENGKKSKMFATWSDMLRRCYCPKTHIKQPTYKDCEVDPLWYNYQNFAEWYQENYIEGFRLDKDLKILHNKTYTPSACSFVPNSVNALLTLSNKNRGKYKVGVNIDKRYGQYQAQCHINGKQSYLGHFDTEEEAHRYYLETKLSEVKRVAEEFKDCIDPVVYYNLSNFTEDQLLKLAES